MRPSWDEYFLAIAQVVASRSVCLRHQIGAVIVNGDQQILSTGYNGPPRGMKHCAERGGCIRQAKGVLSGTRQEYCYGLHAEQNAIVQAAREGIRLLGSTLYCTYKPCSLCARMIVNAGIREVHFFADYPDELTQTILTEGGVTSVKWDGPTSGLESSAKEVRANGHISGEEGTAS
ncbi:MAG TPA: cytidine/deoxycytidylate deaminase family protein [Anaerolineae bacterium]|nr:cytidine/deoxycytidylate deaminase family protein [Anaerolineae bacterium]